MTTRPPQLAEEGDTSPGASAGDAVPCRSQGRGRRFPWSEELHRVFVAAIFDVGLKNASPKTLLPCMQPLAEVTGLTTEHLKSHLQKYRLHYQRSQAEFLEHYDESGARRKAKRRRRNSNDKPPVGPIKSKYVFPVCLGSTTISRDGGSVEVRGASETVRQMPSNPVTVEPPAHDCTVKVAPTLLPTSTSLLRSMVKPLDPTQLWQLVQQSTALAIPATPATDAPSGVHPLAALAAATATASGVNTVVHTGLTPRATRQPSTVDPQWAAVLASLLTPQLGPSPASMSVAESIQREPLVLNDMASPALQLQIYEAMHAQMDLHRQVLHRKVAVSQHYGGGAPPPPSRPTVASSSTIAGPTPLDYAVFATRPPSTLRYSSTSGPLQLGGRPTMTESSQAALPPPATMGMGPLGSSSSLSSSSALATPTPWHQMELELGLALDDPSDPLAFSRTSSSEMQRQ